MGGVGEKIKFGKEVDADKFYLCNFRIQRVWCIFISFPFPGLGVAMIITSLMISIYYNVIVSWSLLYLYNSFALEVPWKSCNNAWNTPLCR